MAAAEARFAIEKLAEGVYAAVNAKPPGLMFDANTVFIVNDEDVLVVDTGITRQSALAAIAELRRLTPRPVRYVVNTHWHDDHIAGNAAWLEAFPGAEVIGHARTRGMLESVGAANRKGVQEGGPGFVAEIRAKLARGENLAGKPATDEEKATLAGDADAAEAYIAASRDFRPVPPTILVEERLTLVRGARTIEIRWLGRAHTGEDLVVHLPKEGIVVAGDLVVWPVPLVGSTSFPADYGATLAKLVALKPAILVPGHGPVMRDLAYPRLLAELMDSLASQARSAVARGESLEEARKSVDLARFRSAIAGGNPLREMLFGFYVSGPGIARAWGQASGKI